MKSRNKPKKILLIQILIVLLLDLTQRADWNQRLNTQLELLLNKLLLLRMERLKLKTNLHFQLKPAHQLYLLKQTPVSLLNGQLTLKAQPLVTKFGTVKYQPLLLTS